MMQPMRAKCLKCGDIVESCFASDEAACRCGELLVRGGELQAFKPTSGNWENVALVDDRGNIILDMGKSALKEEEHHENTEGKDNSVNDLEQNGVIREPNRKALIKEMYQILNHYKDIPQDIPVSHKDFITTIENLLAIIYLDC